VPTPTRKPKKAPTLTPSRTVAYNLRRARLECGWGQKEAVTRLAEHLSRPWSVATYSQAERSATGKRVRQFSADEIAAFAWTFNRPVTFFFAAPENQAPTAEQLRLLATNDGSFYLSRRVESFRRQAPKVVDEWLDELSTPKKSPFTAEFVTDDPEAGGDGP
jgi:hypothetical protein